MRTTDPIAFIQDHRDTIFRVLGILALLLVILLIIRAVAVRLGGRRAAWRRLCREIAVTAAGFAAPPRLAAVPPLAADPGTRPAATRHLA